MSASEFVVIDYGMGNLRSVRNALSFLGCDAAISGRPEDIEKAAGLILPGVGAFGEAMQNLNVRGLIEPIRRKVLDEEAPLLGICLGMQLIAERSEERGEHEGLALIPGHVRRVPAPPGLPLPHVGWNPISVVRAEPFLSGIDEGESFYFVHSYCLETEKQYVAATCNYGVDFVAAVQKGNLFATQFHPERSQTKGLRLLRNFVNFAQAAQSGRVGG